MAYQRFARALPAAAAALGAGMASAQQGEEPAPAPCRTVPARTPVVIEIADGGGVDLMPPDTGDSD